MKFKDLFSKYINLNMNFGELGIAPTNYCNAKCLFCSSNAISNKNFEKHITVHDAIKLIEASLVLGCKKIIITGGGEPTTRIGDILKIIKFAKSKNMKSSIVTNTSYATTTKEAMKLTLRLKQAGMDSFVLSFDQEHLAYIPYKNYLNAIKAASKYGLNTMIQVVDRRLTKNKNTYYLKKLALDLHGKYKTTFFSKLSKIFGIFLHEKNWIFLKNKFIEIIRARVEYIGRAKSLKEFRFEKKENLVFDGTFCSKTIFSEKGLLFMNFDNNMTVGCCWPSLRDLSFKYDNKNFKRELKNKEVVLKNITSILGFLNLFLSIKNLELKNKRKFLKEKYYDKCNLCMDMMKVLSVEDLKNPSNIQVFFFVIFHVRYLIIRCFQDIFIKIFSKNIFSTVAKKILMA